MPGEHAEGAGEDEEDTGGAGGQEGGKEEVDELSLSLCACVCVCLRMLSSTSMDQGPPQAEWWCHLRHALSVVLGVEGESLSSYRLFFFVCLPISALASLCKGESD